MPSCMTYPSMPSAPHYTLSDGTTRPIHRIFCIGSNYAAHIREMGGKNPNVEPVIFMKPASAIAKASRIPYPHHTVDLQHEVELVLAMDESGIAACAVGIDFTKRDLQAKAKERSGPWDVSKAYPNAAALGSFHPGPPPASGSIQLRVGDELRQNGRLENMNNPPDALIALVDRYFQLTAGDLIFTGTPAGVSAVFPGDELRAEIEGLPPLICRIASKEN